MKVRLGFAASLAAGFALAAAGCGEDTSFPNFDQGATTVVPEGNASSEAALATAPVAADAPDFVYDADVFAHACNAAGEGRDLGNLVGSMPLTNCLGETIDLHDYCGRRKAILLVSSAGWCGACRSSMPELALLQESGRREGLDVFVVWGEKDDGSGADADFCNLVSDQYGTDPARTFFDPGFSSVQNRLNPVAPGENSYGLPWHAIVDPFDMTYYWSSSDQQGVSEDQALGLLLAD